MFGCFSIPGSYPNIRLETGRFAGARHVLPSYETITLPLTILPLPLSRSVLRTGKRVLASSLVKLRQLFQPFPLLLVMTENHQPDLLPFGQIKQFHPTFADGSRVRVAPVVLLVTGKALG